MAKTFARFGAGMVLILASSMPAMAQAPDAAKEVTLIGCVELEKDYRARKEAGRGGVLGSGVGVGNEFVLTAAKMTAGPGRRGATVGTAGAAGDYSLTGRLERDLLRQVGRQVEVVGTLEEGKSGELPIFNISLWHPVGDFCPAK